MLSGRTVPPDSKEIEIGSSDQEVSPAGKNTRVVLVPMFMHGSASLQLFPVIWICLKSLGVICYDS